MSESEVAANSPNPFFRSKEFQPTPYPELTRLYFLHDLLVFLCHHDAAADLFWAASGGPGGKLVPYVNANDLLAWGCADATEITPENFEQLKQAFTDCAQAAAAAGLDEHLAIVMSGAALFSCRVANMRPQGAAYPDKEYFTALRPLFDACGPERPVGLGNPYAPGDYKPTCAR